MYDIFSATAYSNAFEFELQYIVKLLFLKNAPYSIFVTLLGIAIFFKLLQLKNANLAMLVTLFGIVYISVSFFPSGYFIISVFCFFSDGRCYVRNLR